jgi:two-component system phosphate regulon response regulator PhoB
MSAAPLDRVLLVDDEPDLRQLVAFNLESAGFDVVAVASGQEALAEIGRIHPAIVILDVMLPDLAGTEVCRRLRADAELADVGVIMLTARGDEADRVLGFEVGADDYVVKPFSVRELVFRVRALARRSNELRAARAATADTGPHLRWRGIELDPTRHRVHADGAELTMRPLEFKLIALFLEHPGRVFTRAELLEEVWGITAELNTRTVDTHIRRLRDKLGAYGDAIQTVHGFGYRLREA